MLFQSGEIDRGMRDLLQVLGLQADSSVQKARNTLNFKRSEMPTKIKKNPNPTSNSKTRNRNLIPKCWNHLPDDMFQLQNAANILQHQ